MNNEDANMANTLALLGRLKTEMPELMDQAKVVGKWVWLEFNVPPLQEVRTKLKELGFRWNRKRRCWQHSCGQLAPRSRSDPQSRYPVTPATEMELNEAAIQRRIANVKEFKIISLRECPLPEALEICDTPQKAADYWHLHVKTIPHFNPDVECFTVLMLNTRRRVKGHQLVSLGTLDTILVHPREVFRAAIIAGSAAIIMMHNHPSGDPTPSDADVKYTRDLIRAGQLVKIEVLDHVIIGNPNHCSLRELGYFL